MRGAKAPYYPHDGRANTGSGGPPPEPTCQSRRPSGSTTSRVSSPSPGSTMSCAMSRAIRPLLLAGLQQLDDDRQDRDGHDGEDGELEVLLDEVDLAQEVPEQRDPDGPQGPADHVERDEGAVVHAGHAGHDRGERAHDGHEPGQHDGLGAVAVEEGLGLVDVVLLEEPGVGPPEDGGTHPPAHQVADLVADDGGDEAPHEQQRQRQVQLVGDAAGSRTPGTRP